MEVISWIFIIAAVIIVAVIAFAIGAIILFYVFLFLPAILGIGAGIWLWMHGHDNWGVIVGIASCFLTYYWMAKVNGDGPSYSDPWAGYKRRYDRDGNIVGYEDPD